MIRYALRCETGGHGFDGWFRSSDDFDRQAGAGLVSCPACGATLVGKELMRPALAGIRSGDAPEAAAADPKAVIEKLQAMSREVRASAEYVGPKFAEEARRIHFGETENRQIYGEASIEQVKELAQDGIPALPLPPLPEDKH